jgi:hypothetical protein
VCWNKVPDEQEDRHHNVLSDRDDIGTRDLQNLDTALHSSVEVDVVGTNTSGNTELEFLGLSGE